MTKSGRNSIPPNSPFLQKFKNVLMPLNKPSKEVLSVVVSFEKEF
jgi:hypothetical protein